MPRDDTGLDHRHAVCEGDLLDLVHACDGKRNAALQRHAAADIAYAGALGCDRNAVRIGKAQHLGNLRRRFSMHNDLGWI